MLNPHRIFRADNSSGHQLAPAFLRVGKVEWDPLTPIALLRPPTFPPELAGDKRCTGSPLRLGACSACPAAAGAMSEVPSSYHLRSGLGRARRKANRS